MHAINPSSVSRSPQFHPSPSKDPMIGFYQFVKQGTSLNTHTFERIHISVTFHANHSKYYKTVYFLRTFTTIKLSKRTEIRQHHLHIQETWLPHRFHIRQ